MRKLFTACLALGFLTAAGIAIFNGFIARPINAYMDATIIAQLMTLPADNITPIATLTAPPVQPTETPTLTAPLAVIVTPTASPLEDVSESVVVTADVTAEGTEPVLPTAIVIAPPFPPPRRPPPRRRTRRSIAGALRWSRPSSTRGRRSSRSRASCARRTGCPS